MGKLFEFITKELTVLLIAAMPLMELRVAIPIGVSIGLSPIHATILGVIGSIIPAPFLLLLIEPIFFKLRQIEYFKRIIDKLVKRTLNKSKNINKYRILGLIIYVGIPLPGTGVWTGSLAAILLRIPFKQALPSIALGSLIAGIIMFTLSFIVVNI